MNIKATIGVIGCGNMGQAIAGLLSKYAGVCAYDSDRKKTACVRFCALEELLEKSSVIILAVKPQNMDGLLSEIRKRRSALKPGSFDESRTGGTRSGFPAWPAGRRGAPQIFVSIAAGISIAFLQKRLPKATAIARTMPNLGLKAGRSFTAICFNKYVSASEKALIRKIFSLLGQVTVIKENMIDKITAISGSGPGYLFYFLKAMEDAALELGFNKKISEQMLRATASGAIRLIERDRASFKDWQDRVCSKGGTTQAALDYLDKNKFGKLISEAIKKAYRRAKELNTD